MHLPQFSVEAAVSGRKLDNAALAGRRAVLVLHGPSGADFAKEVSKAVRQRHPSAKDVVVASIVDLRSMGGMWRRVAEAQIRKTYEKLSARVQEHLPGESPEEHVLVCPDWDGSVVTALGQPDAGDQPVALVLRADGTVQATVAAAQGGAAVLASLSA